MSQHPDRESAAQSAAASRFQVDRPVPLEQRSLMAPVVATFPLTPPSRLRDTDECGPGYGDGLGEHGGDDLDTMAPITSVSELTPTVVRRRHRDDRSGPGGVFGNAVYAISRGAGDNTERGASIARA